MLAKRISVLVSLIGGLFALALSAIPTGTAYACLPCDCPDNTSINCWGPYQLYTDDDSQGNCMIDVWIIDANGQGKQALTLTSEDIAALPAAETIDRYTLIGDAYNGYISLYKLQTGAYQLNVGPDGEGKVHTIDWVGCPADHIHEDTFRVG